jgi:hypothetical protein
MRRTLFAVALSAGLAFVAWRASRPTAQSTHAPGSSSDSSRSVHVPEKQSTDTFVATAPLPPAVRESALVRPESENEYLHELMRLHAADKSRALTLAKKGDEWYSSTGRPAEARKAMAITLLVDLDEMEEARRETREFIAAYPASPYRTLVQGVTGIHPRPHGPFGLE